MQRTVDAISAHPLHHALLLLPVPRHRVCRCCRSPRDKPSRNKVTRGEKQCDPVQLCPGSAKLRAWGLQGDRFPAARQDVATPVWRMSEPWHRSGGDGDGASRQSTSSGGRERGGRAVLAACSCQGHYIRFEKKAAEFNCQRYCSGNCNRNDSGSCQVAKLL